MKKLSDLILSDFDECAVWETVPEEICESSDEFVWCKSGKTSIEDGESDLWVRFSGCLADGTSVKGIAMAVASPPDLLLWSFQFDGQWLVLHLPPAPDFVLHKTGPQPFAEILGKTIDKVFPIRIETEVKFETTGEIIRKVIAP